jgi:hypothetical protein
MSVNPSDDFGFLFDYLWKPILAFLVAKKLFVRQADFAVCKPFALAP